MTSAKGMSASGRLTGHHRQPGPAIEGAGDPEADAVDLAAHRCARLVDRLHAHLHETRLVEPQRWAQGAVVHREVSSHGPGQ
jgi:hypothetical protein